MGVSPDLLKEDSLSRQDKQLSAAWCTAGFFVCKLKKVANGPKEQLGGEEDVPSDMEGAEDGVTVEEDEAPQKPPKARAGQAEGRKRSAAEADAGEYSVPQHGYRTLSLCSVRGTE